jgi:hypothetical protein
MAQPTAYEPSHEFLTDEGLDPNIPGSELDIEFNAIELTLDEVLANLALIQRDDGALKNGVVTTDSLDPDLLAVINSLVGDNIEDLVEALESKQSIDGSGNITPATADGGALGTALLQWSDGFFASGAVLNFDAGDVTITHSAGLLTISDSLLASSLTALGTLGVGTNLTLGGYADLVEIAAPSSPSVNIARVYARDNGSGTTKLYFKDSAGTETELGAGGSSFATINCPSGTDPVADSATDTLNLAEGTGISISGDSGTDTVTFSVDTELAALRTALSSNGIIARTGSATYAIREVLAAEKTLNVGAAQTYTTGQAAVDYALTIETQGYDVILQLADASLSGAIEVNGPLKGGGRLYIRGDTSTPGNRILTNATNTDTLHVRDGAFVYVEGIKFTATGGTSANCLRTSFGGTITVNADCTFGTTTGYHLVNGAGGTIFLLSSYSIDGDALGHWLLSTATGLSIQGGITITLTGTPAWTNEFVQLRVGASCRCWTVTFSGSATGRRFLIEPGAILDTNGTDPNTYFPGDTPGVIEYNGVYDGYEGPARSQGKNLIIGGDFTTNPWQRGTTFSSVVNGGLTADLFFATYVSGGVVDAIKAADAPTIAQCGVYTASSLHIDVTTADAAIAATDRFAIDHKIEGQNISFLGFGQTGTRYVTLSFFVKSTKTGVFCVALQNSAANRSYVKEYTVSAADTWERKVLTFPVDTSGTWLYDTGVGLRVRWALMAGTNFQATADTWVATNSIATSTPNNFKLALCQMEAGARASQFDALPADIVLQRCRRYAFVGSVYVPATTAQNLRSLDMRATPTITGGAAGFDSTGTTKDSLIAFQTGAAVTALTLTADMS